MSSNSILSTMSTTTTTTNPNTSISKSIDLAASNSIVSVDIGLIEQQKENIVPLSSGRSASHLTNLSLQSRSTLELKLSNEHTKFQNQIKAIELYESEGTWIEGQNGFTMQEIEKLTDDPIDVHLSYVRFVVENYPAGNSATSKLVPLLEESTRKFLGCERYKNDPRYLRLWTTYARYMNSSEDCYRFLFAKGIGERLASLYEEYARVLEVLGKREQAHQVYSLGIDRLAVPMLRLKKSRADFEARMALAPPINSPLLSPSSSTISPFTLSTLSSSTSNSLLNNSSNAPILGLSTSSTTPARENNAREFAIFKDSDSGVDENLQEGKWEDLGTIKSRRRENDQESTEWKGETLIMGGRAAAPPVARMEVFRDDDAPRPSTSSATSSDHTDTLTKSIRGPSEAELLKLNPFKNYSAADLSLTSIDPVLDVSSKEIVVPSSSSTSKSSGKSSSSSKKSSSSKSSKSSSGEKVKSSTVVSPSTAPGLPVEKKPERVACNLKEVYPEGATEFSSEEDKLRKRPEFSFEEIKLKKNNKKYSVDPWADWEWLDAWTSEAERNGVDSYLIDSETSWPLLYDSTGAPLWEFLPQPIPLSLASPTPSPQPIRQQQLNLLDSTPTSSPQRAQQQIPSQVLSPIILTDQLISYSSPEASPQQQEIPVAPIEDSPPRFYPDPNRRPSPTMNTRQAEAMVNDLFAHTLKFGGGSGDFDDDDDEPSTAEDTNSEDDDEDEQQVGGANPYFVIPPSQASQYSQFEDGSQLDDDHPFVPFSQTASQLEVLGTGDSFRMGSQAVLEGLSEEDEYDEEEDENQLNDENRVRPRPMTLFRDPVVTAIPIDSNGNSSSTRGGFRPVVKTGRTFGTPMASQRAFMVMKDEPQEDLIDETRLEEEEEFEGDEFEAPLREEEFSDDDEPRSYRQGELGDGFGYGRRAQGANRFAPMIDNMTPITERTCEFSSVTRTTSTLSNSQRSRRDSAHPITAPVIEEDEEDVSSESDEEFGDRAFVAYAENSNASNNESSSNSSSASSSSSDEEEEEVEHVPQVSSSFLVDHQATISNDSIPEWRDSTRKDAQFDDVSVDRSYDVSINSSLPEGFTINGNQSGMTTGLVLTDTSNFDQNNSSNNSSFSSPSSFSNPCNPYSTETINTVLALASPPILDHQLVRNVTNITANKLTDLQKTAKRKEAKKSKDGKVKDRTGVFDEVWELQLDNETFSVREKLGEGAFGAVFRIATALTDEFDEDDEDLEETSIAVKVEQPTNLWEFQILQQLHSRLPPRIRNSIVAASRLYAFKDESYLFLEFSDQGTLLDAVNKASESGISPPTGGITLGLEEVVAMFFIIELLRVLEGFHNAGFVHGDLKIDNCLVRLEEPIGGSKAWSSTYDPSGGGGWSSKGLKLIDFGRSIDRNIFSPQQTFLSTLPTDEFDCIEMRESKPWTFEPDYFGVASIAFNLLFGRYIETKEIVGEKGERRFVIAQTFKRYHQEELWTSLFEALLNPKNVREDGQLPITNELTTIRIQMENWLQKNSDKNGKNLRSLIRKMETYWLARA